ncbi:tryptophanyl-tRNA synthetase [Pseudomonas jinjuensis]|uniref:tryptophan--tRNA ligase n=2 Tax=Pseudomonas jinjuensis TaxID=198616 RepID=A0A1G9YJU2_9PSED|nr:tryptophanyl-tRNA synthetase [Pseudomonas jinjuensis]
MRPIGPLHLGHYHSTLRDWTRLQHEYECFFSIADWHALTTEFSDADGISQHVWEMAIDWLSVGLSPSAATLFIQSQVPEHAELYLLLSMICPLPWLERVPTYRELQERLSHHDLSSFGFLGYPLLQAADILIYRAGLVAAGTSQQAHVEFTREIARRFNHLYGGEEDFEEKVRAAMTRLGKKTARLYGSLRRTWQEQGDTDALETARALLDEQKSMTLGDRERLFGYLEGSGRVLLPEPQSLPSDTPRMPGLDGQRMARTLGNVIALRDSLAEVEEKISRMPTDPARVRRSDPGEPERCPVWQWHQVYSDQGCRNWVEQGCRSAGIGCLDCKRPVIESVRLELQPIQERALDYEDNPELVRSILAEGAEKAREAARETLVEVRQAMGLAYR